MNNKILKTCIISFVLIVPLIIGAAKIITIDVGGLKAEKIKEREEAAEIILKNHKEMIKQLIDFAAEKVEPLFISRTLKAVEYPWHDSKHLSILLLGDLRAAEAVPILLDNLEYENIKSIDPYRLIGPDEWYPAVEALYKIGIPSVDPVIKKLGTYDKKCVARDNCCFILRAILGTKLALYRLEIAIEETKDLTVKQNLTVVLPYFKTEKEYLK